MLRVGDTKYTYMVWACVLEDDMKMTLYLYLAKRRKQSTAKRPTCGAVYGVGGMER